jgi:hypothetical protein
MLFKSLLENHQIPILKSILIGLLILDPWHSRQYAYMYGFFLIN